MGNDIKFVITQEQLATLSEQIRNNVTDAHMLAGGPGGEFCKVWPAASEGLTALKGILELVPGVSALAGVAIGIALAAGNAASSAVCSKS
ncbi:hypothetical protein [Cupriavidus malaysiensis]|uniref:hypothetical protein n=1 Tax=Cupriavidus malaysiensis TaxID=367825 RepID=UPI0012FFD000|nr:hypothetical protein [Cupriavidus malaysiensis]